MTTARDVEQMLRRHYLPEGRPPGGMFAAEITSPDGKRRADVIWMETTTVGRGALHGHEIKVSRADVVHELADPTKMDAWARYCDFWWLVVSDPTLVGGLDIPEHWGIMSPPSGRRTRSMTVVRKATRLHPIDKAAALVRLLTWRHYGAHETEVTLRRDLHWRDRDLERIREENRRLRLSGANGRPDPLADRVQRIIEMHHAARSERAKASGQWEIGYTEATDDDIVAALLDLTTIRTAAMEQQRALERAQHSLADLADPLARARSILSEATA